MIHDHKAGKSIYDTLTVDAASQIHHILSFQVLKMQDSISQKRLLEMSGSNCLGSLTQKDALTN